MLPPRDQNCYTSLLHYDRFAKDLSSALNLTHFHPVEYLQYGSAYALF